MRASKCGRPPPRDAGSGPRECRKLAGVDNSENSTSGHNLKELPSRVTLARRWPALKVNRLTWRWIDAASGERGEDLQSLLAFLGSGGR